MIWKAASLLAVIIGSDKILDEFRSNFQEILKNEQKLEYYMSAFEKSKDPVKMAYFGLMKARSAEFQFWPQQKLSAFYAGKASLEKAISMAPHKLEPRMARIILQCKAPGFLNYSGDINVDLEKISNMGNDPGYIFVLKQLKTTDCLSSKQKLVLENASRN